MASTILSRLLPKRLATAVQALYGHAARVWNSPFRRTPGTSHLHLNSPGCSTPVALSSGCCCCPVVTLLVTTRTSFSHQKLSGLSSLFLQHLCFRHETARVDRKRYLPFYRHKTANLYIKTVSPVADTVITTFRFFLRSEVSK